MRKYAENIYGNKQRFYELLDEFNQKLEINIEPFDLTNNRYLFYLIINSFIKLIDITRKSSIDISNRIKIFNDEKEIVSPIINDLEKLILNINESNYDNIINNLKNIRKNLSIDNYISLFENKMKNKITNIINIFEILTKSYNDIFLWYIKRLTPSFNLIDIKSHVKR